ncbi:hypothetical protein Aph01nite_39760 [Acrocarpospora phusangensis]|uniref:Uncharacterized protein n=1 Tax=Acrocarpospora phusangensis TaxID=1070424 RepID=A0A919UL21_9ACTN|nr:hypothetical protein [Acrocarpospora phusangensis]GIH25666.1 hypothetical protein Aph01nite_39760 [Acrocarpospora phusangensis]
MTLLRILGRLANEADAVLALGIAVVVGILGITSVASEAVTGNAVLVTLGVLSLSILRDRWRRAEMTEEIVETLRGMDGVAAEMARANTVLAQATVALGEQSLAQIRSRRESVAEELARARENTGRWLFRGGTGTYIRAVTLPELIRRARLERRPLNVRLEILDPTDLTVCDRYARFRRSVSELPDGTGEIWTTERTQLESYATIFAACWYQAMYSLLDVRIGLATTMGIFRCDMSDDRLVITQDDGPAMVVPRQSFLYASYETELRTSLDQARPVHLDKADGIALSAEPTVDEVLRLFDALDVPLVVSHDLIPQIVAKAIRPKNPYS